MDALLIDVFSNHPIYLLRCQNISRSFHGVIEGGELVRRDGNALD